MSPTGFGASSPVVHLVGAGPGSADLLTVRATRILAAADVVLHDQLVTGEVLALARGAEIVPVGRRRGTVFATHDAVIDRIVDEVAAGRRVVRLKGGDPVVFGRGGEEALDLARRGIATELVPGISSCIAAPELAGIPLTHRGLSSGFLVVTGHRSDGPGLRARDAAVAGAFDGTVVVLMGGTRLLEVCRQLRHNGRAAGTPTAVIADAGRPGQRVVVGDLESLPVLAATERIGTPAVLVVGDVVAVPDAVGDAVRESAGDALQGRGRRTSTAACL